MVKIEEGWHKVLEKEFDKPYFKDLTEKVRKEYKDPWWNPLMTNCRTLPRSKIQGIVPSSIFSLML